MEKDKLIEWFYEKFNSCYPVIHQDYTHKIYLFYDKQFIRKMKLCKINNIELTFPSKISGDCLFELDFKSEYIWCSNDEIWSFLESNYNNNYQEIKSFIKDRLQDDTKLRVLTPQEEVLQLIQALQDDTKLRVLTPAFRTLCEQQLQDDTKLRVLTPAIGRLPMVSLLQDDTKLRVLTPYKDRLVQLQDDTKLRVLTPTRSTPAAFKILLQDDTKLRVLTPMYFSTKGFTG